MPKERFPSSGNHENGVRGLKSVRDQNGMRGEDCVRGEDGVSGEDGVIEVDGGDRSGSDMRYKVVGWGGDRTWMGGGGRWEGGGKVDKKSGE